MIGMVCALRWEANPIIRYFGLKKDRESKKLDIYYNDDIMLVISGVGMVKSAVATAFLYSKISTDLQRKIVLLINIGICGSLNINKPLGKCFLANKISNVYSKKDFYPDILIKHKFEEATLITYSVPVTQEDNIMPEEKALVDMEGAGFFEAGSIFLPSHKMVCLKVLSDKASPESVSPKLIEDIIEKNIKDIELFICNQKEAVFDQIILSEKEKVLIQDVAAKMRLTTAQHNIFYQLCLYKKNRKQSLDLLNKYLSINITDKAERSKAFEQLKEALSS
jgi:nucleoside phosphorylase